MIQNIFLPEKIRNYYIFAQKVVGIDITKTHIHASLLIAKGSMTYIKKQVSEPLNTDIANHSERVIEKLPALMQSIGKVDQIRTNIASSQVIFKELRMPFTSREKINLVIHFEVEQLLPFPMQDAIIDFIITGINNQDQSAQVLVAATQKHFIAQQLSLFEQAALFPTAITVDMFALYNLYMEIPTYKSLEGLVVVLDLDMYNTRIVIIENQKLRIIRTLPDGLATPAKDAGTATQLKPSEVLANLVRFGSDGDKSIDKNDSFSKSLSSYFSKIQFALTSTLATLQNKQITKILLIGAGTEIKDITVFAQNNLQSPCELFDGNLLIQNKQYKIAKNFSLLPSNIISIGTAMLCPPTVEFNFKKGEFSTSQTTLVLKQLIVSGILIVALFSSLITNTIIQISRLQNEINASQQEVVQELKNRFHEIPEEEEELEEVIKSAKEELKKEEDIWMAFSSQARTSFLEYLLELSTRINKQQLGFVPEQLTIIDGPVDEITLKAKVRDFDALKQLEKVLQQSKLFSYIESPPSPDFSMKIKIAHTM